LGFDKSQILKKIGFINLRRNQFKEIVDFGFQNSGVQGMHLECFLYPAFLKLCIVVFITGVVNIQRLNEPHCKVLKQNSVWDESRVIALKNDGCGFLLKLAPDHFAFDIGAPRLEQIGQECDSIGLDVDRVVLLEPVFQEVVPEEHEPVAVFHVEVVELRAELAAVHHDVAQHQADVGVQVFDRQLVLRVLHGLQGLQRAHCVLDHVAAPPLRKLLADLVVHKVEFDYLHCVAADGQVLRVQVQPGLAVRQLVHHVLHLAEEGVEVDEPQVGAQHQEQHAGYVRLEFYRQWGVHVDGLQTQMRLAEQAGLLRDAVAVLKLQFVLQLALGVDPGEVPLAENSLQALHLGTQSFRVVCIGRTEPVHQIDDWQTEFRFEVVLLEMWNWNFTDDVGEAD